ncbi:MAG: dTMP kinase [Deltaproteobacteria bacterium]|nr:dTMP kinase [Deltaproteobacteria bacterium]
MATGKLIVLEGIDGAGTTTQAERLVLALRASGRDAHLTRQPSGGPIGRLLRDFLLGEHAPVDPTTMALLFAADRADHLSREVEPALRRGAIVVSDRWYHSSLAYQGAETDFDWVLTINARARRPDLTVLLEVPVELAAMRRKVARRQEELYDQLDVQRRVAVGYQRVIERLGSGERIVTCDGSRPVEELGVEILGLVLETGALPCVSTT